MRPWPLEILWCAGLILTIITGRADPTLRQRETKVESYVAAEPLFSRQARTLDPATIARQCWKGYLTMQPEPWGFTAGLKPTLRFHFDNRALPWARLKHHSVDCFDNNARNAGAHALLHEMFGPEKKGDPAEAGQMAYLMGCTDPASGFAYSPDSLPRHCPLGEGEMARNIMMLYERTENPVLLGWAKKMVETLRRFAVVYEREGIGKVAEYRQGGKGGQGGFNVGEEPKGETTDPTIEGWQHLYVGWALGAFAKWHEMTRDPSALEFATALANRLCNSSDPDGNDGAFRPDGSFGGKSQASVGSWHMHGHTHCLPGLVHLGTRLITSGQEKAGVRFISQASRVMDWLYDPARNPDAGSMTGWLGEWLIVATGWNRKTDCEGCTMGDVTQVACALGAASRSHPELAELVRFYDRAEQIYTGQVMEQMFQVTPRYLQVMKELLTKAVEKEMSNATPQEKSAALQRRFELAKQAAERMVGQQMGLCGFPDRVNHMKSDLDPELPGIHMQGCCADATIRASHAVWSESVSGNEKEARVNLAFNRDSPLLQVVSSLPHRGEINVIVKEARRVLVRVPEWVQKEQVKAYINKKPVRLKWERSYVVFEKTREGKQLTVVYPLRIATVMEPIQGVSYTERWRGNTIVNISPGGKWLPMYERPELETENLPE